MRGSHPPKQVLEPSQFFDPVTGDPLIWYYEGPDGRIEFFDERGFHPRYAKPLLPVTPEIAQKYESSHPKISEESDNSFRMASITAHTIRVQLQKQTVLEGFLGDLRRESNPDRTAIQKAEAGISQIDRTINQNLTSYGDALEHLKKIYSVAPEKMKSSYDRTIGKWSSEGSNDQIATARLVWAHLEKFTKRNTDAWRNDLARLK